MKPLKLSIIIPCYNEAKNLPLLIEKLQYFKKINAEVILVDNGSKDNTQEVLQQELAKPGNEFLTSVKVEKNIGYGFGIMSGVRKATGDVIAWTHADMQTDPNDIVVGLQHFHETEHPENLFVKGQRINRNAMDEFFTAGMARISSAALGIALHDINAQPKMFHRSFVNRLEHAPDDFSLDLYVLYLAKKTGMHIIEIPVRFEKRMYGEAKGGGSWKTKMKLIKRTWAYIFQLRDELKSGKR